MAVLLRQRKGEAAVLPAPHSVLPDGPVALPQTCAVGEPLPCVWSSAILIFAVITQQTLARVRGCAAGGDADVGDRHGAQQHCGLRVQAVRAGQGRLHTLRTTPVRPRLPLLLSLLCASRPVAAPALVSLARRQQATTDFKLTELQANQTQTAT